MFALRRSAATFASSARSFSSSPRSQAAKIMLLGRLTRQPEVKMDSKGGEYVVYSLACKDHAKTAEASFFTVAKFSLNDTMKNLLTNLPKGTLVHVTADVQHKRGEGDTAPRLSLRQSDIEILSRPRPRSQEEENGDWPQQQQ